MTTISGAMPEASTSSIVLRVPAALSRCGVCTSTGSSCSTASASCSVQRLVLGRRHRVEADLADRDDAVLGQEARQDVDHLAAQEVVVGLLRVQADRAVMADAELRRRGSAPSRAAS